MSRAWSAWCGARRSQGERTSFTGVSRCFEEGGGEEGGVEEGGGEEEGGEEEGGEEEGAL